MRTITNERVIKRNALIGRYSSLTGLAVLLGGLVISFVRPDLYFVPFYTLIGGFLLSNLGIMLSNRWVRSPRPDQALDAALKGLDDRHQLYHYRFPNAHALFSPAGVFALIPKFQAGRITYEGSRWRHSGYNRLTAFFGQEGLGNPTAEARAEASALLRFLHKHIPDVDNAVQPIIVFTNPKAEVRADDAPCPAMHAKKLKDYLRKLPKGQMYTPEQMAILHAALKITDR